MTSACCFPYIKLVNGLGPTGLGHIYGLQQPIKEKRTSLRSHDSVPTYLFPIQIIYLFLFFNASVSIVNFEMGKKKKKVDITKDVYSYIHIDQQFNGFLRYTF